MKDLIWIDQCSNGIKLRNFDMKYYSQIHSYLSENFKGSFVWLSFSFSFFINDSLKGRSETIKEIKEFTKTLKK